MLFKRLLRPGLIAVSSLSAVVCWQPISDAADHFEATITVIRAVEPGGDPDSVTQPAAHDAAAVCHLVVYLPSGQEVRRPVRIGETVRLELPAPGSSRVTCVAETSWAPTVRLTTGSPHATLQLHRAGVVTGSVATDPGRDVEGLAVRFIPVGSDPTALLDDQPKSGAQEPAGLLSGKGRCELDEQGRFYCLLPVGHYDLRIRTPDLAARFFWGVAVASGAATDVGTVRLYPESTVTGHLIPVADLPVPSECHIQALPEGTRPTLPADQEPEIPIADKGRFQIQGVSAGLNALYVSCPGFALAEVHRIEVVRGSDVMIYDPVPLSPSIDLVGDISPPLSPEGALWKILLADRDRRRGLRAESEADAAGRWSINGMQGGRFGVVVETATEPPTMRFHAGEVLIEPDPLPVFIEVDLVEVEGRVLFGDEPIAALVTFGLSTVPAQTVPYAIATAGADGHFRVWLSDERWQAGMRFPWPVVVESSDTGLSLETLVTIRKPKERGTPATVDIVIPKTAVRGRVVDGDDQPVSGARVLADVTKPKAEEYPEIKGPTSTSVTDNTPIVSDSDGAFELVGLPEGTARVWAKDDTGRESAPEVVEVTGSTKDSAEQQPVVLRLEDRRRVTLIVDSDGQPVASATVDVRVRGSAVARPAVTDRTGVARTSVSVDNDDEVLLSILPPGRCLTSVARQLPDSDQPLHVNVATRGCGRIEVVLPAGIDTSLYYLDGEGGGFTSFRLSSWARSNLPEHESRSLLDAVVANEPFALPRVAAGAYSSCLFTSRESMYRFLSTGAAQPGECLAPQFLEPYGVATFDHSLR